MFLIRLSVKSVIIYIAKNAQDAKSLSTSLQQTCYQQSDIRMRSNGLRQLVDDTSVSSCQQTFYKLIVKTSES